MAGTLVYASIPTAEILTRASRPVALATVEAEGFQTKVRVPVRDRLDPKGITTVVPLSKIAGDPIDFLDTTRNAPVRPVKRWGYRHADPALGLRDLKRGDYERAEATLPILRETFAVSGRRSTSRRGAYINAINLQKPRILLGANGSGFDFYRSFREKPGFPVGFLGYQAPSGMGGLSAFGQQWALAVAPYLTSTKLANEGRLADARATSGAAVAAAPFSVDNVRLAHGSLVKASSDPAGKPNHALWLVGGVIVLAFLFGR